MRILGVKRRSLQVQSHGKPVTRRDFLARGLIAGSSYLMMPSVLSLILKEHEARAAGVSCGSALTYLKGRKIALITMDLSGGHAFNNHTVMPLDQSGNLLPASAYKPTGLNLPTVTTDSSFGHPIIVSNNGVPYGFHQTISQFFANNPNIPRSAVSIASVPVQNNSDTSINVGNPTSVMAVANGMHTFFGSINTQLLPAAAQVSAVKADSVTSLRNGLVPSLQVSKMNNNQVKSLAAGVDKLSSAIAYRLANNNSLSQFGNNLSCGAAGVAANLNNPDLVVDPTQDSHALQAFGNGTTISDPMMLQLAILVTNALNSGAVGSISAGGYDNHDGQNTANTVTNATVASYLMAMTKYAVLAGVTVIVAFITDGGMVSASDPTLGATNQGDRNEAGGYLLAVCSGSGVSPFINPHVTWANYFTQGGAASQATFAGLRSQNAGAALALNMAAQVGGDFFNKVVQVLGSSGIAPPTDLTGTVIFNQKA